MLQLKKNLLEKQKNSMVKFLLTLSISLSSYAGWFSNPVYNPDGEFVDYGNHLPEDGEFKKGRLGAHPSDATLKHYFTEIYLSGGDRYVGYGVEASTKPSVFEADLQEFKPVTDALAETGLVSYLFYEDGKIKVDAKSPKNRFGDMFNDGTQLRSNSVGKNMVSYVLGHAICAGYIKDVNEKMDWWVLKDTLYENQRLQNLINMRSGDHNHVGFRGLINHSGRRNGNPNNYSILEIMSNEINETKASSNKKFHYNGLQPNIVINYIRHKLGTEDEYLEFLNDIFNKKIGVENDVWFAKRNRYSDYEVDGLSKSTFFASRYDYLRIAKSMLEDWNNDTCVGQYLKTVYENREHKGTVFLKTKSPNYPFGTTTGYGGFFHTDYKGYWGNPNILIMDGYGGQMIWINFDDNRIVVTNAIHSSYDWKNIVADVVKNGLEK